MMQLTKFTDVALRLLLHLAMRPGEKTTARHLAAIHGVPFNHVAKIIAFLAREGYIDTARGRGGGVALRLAPEDIRIGALVRRSEANVALVECERHDGLGCRFAIGCGLHPVLNAARKAFFEVLDDHSLQDALDGSDLAALARILDDLTGD